MVGGERPTRGPRPLGRPGDFRIPLVPSETRRWKVGRSKLRSVKWSGVYKSLVVSLLLTTVPMYMCVRVYICMYEEFKFSTLLIHCLFFVLSLVLHT